MTRYPGLEMAEEQAKLAASEDRQAATMRLAPEWQGVPLPKLDAPQSVTARGPGSDATQFREPVLTMPSMADLVRANDAVLAELDSRCTQLEAMGDRVLGTEPCAVAKGSPRFPGDTVGARLWRQNTEFADALHRLGRAIDRLKQFA